MSDGKLEVKECRKWSSTGLIERETTCGSECLKKIKSASDNLGNDQKPGLWQPKNNKQSTARKREEETLQRYKQEASLEASGN